MDKSQQTDIPEITKENQLLKNICFVPVPIPIAVPIPVPSEALFAIMEKAQSYEEPLDLTTKNK